MIKSKYLLIFVFYNLIGIFFKVLKYIVIKWLYFNFFDIWNVVFLVRILNIWNLYIWCLVSLVMNIFCLVNEKLYFYLMFGFLFCGCVFFINKYFWFRICCISFFEGKENCCFCFIYICVCGGNVLYNKLIYFILMFLGRFKFGGVVGIFKFLR